MTCTLKIVVGLADTDTTLTLSLPDPKDGLTRAEVDTAMGKAIDEDVISVNGNIASSVKKVYIHRQEDVELV